MFMGCSIPSTRAKPPRFRKDLLQSGMRVALLKDLPDWRAHLPDVEEIFFTSSAVQQFSDADARARFRERWLARYLEHYSESFFVALARDQDHAQTEKVIGYLAGCLRDPRNDPLFADLAYYAAFAPLCDTYPAHLHINVAAEARSRGVGAALIAAFAAQCAAARLPGLHLVTGEGARNVRFYERCGFRQLATTESNGKPVVFMGRRVDPAS
jgi:GNAT superfamily N-acetyltransferase